MSPLRCLLLSLVSLVTACTSSAGDQYFQCDEPARSYCREYVNVEGRMTAVDAVAAERMCGDESGTWTEGGHCVQAAVGRCIREQGYVSVEYYYNGFSGRDYEADPSLIDLIDRACTEGLLGTFQRPPFSPTW